MNNPFSSSSDVPHRHQRHRSGSTRGGERHDEHGHKHNDASEVRLRRALVIVATFMVVEAGGGIIAHSLVLLADAGHMFADAGALALSIVALRIGRRPANSRYSYGHDRYQVLAAFTNGLALMLLSLWIIGEGVRRLLTPEPVIGWAMLVVAAMGLAANFAAFMVLSNASGLNERGALAHVVGDLMGSIAAIVAAAVIILSGWLPIDPILSIFISLMILRSAWRLTRESAHVLLEGTPRDFDVKRVEAEIVGSIPGVSGVHHVHVWSLNGEAPMLTLHAHIDQGVDRQIALTEIHHRLRDQLGVSHVTVQIEEGQCVQTTCAPGGRTLH